MWSAMKIKELQEILLFTQKLVIHIQLATQVCNVLLKNSLVGSQALMQA
jgi:hypothetical protein